MINFSDVVRDTMYIFADKSNRKELERAFSHEGRLQVLSMLGQLYAVCVASENVGSAEVKDR